MATPLVTLAGQFVEHLMCVQPGVACHLTPWDMKGNGGQQRRGKMRARRLPCCSGWRMGAISTAALFGLPRRSAQSQRRRAPLLLVCLGRLAQVLGFGGDELRGQHSRRRGQRRGEARRRSGSQQGAAAAAAARWKQSGRRGGQRAVDMCGGDGATLSLRCLSGVWAPPVLRNVKRGAPSVRWWLVIGRQKEKMQNYIHKSS